MKDGGAGQQERSKKKERLWRAVECLALQPQERALRRSEGKGQRPAETPRTGGPRKALGGQAECGGRRFVWGQWVQ